MMGELTIDYGVVYSTVLCVVVVAVMAFIAGYAEGKKRREP